MAHITGHSSIGFQGTACEQKVAGFRNLYKFSLMYASCNLLQGFAAHESIQPCILVKYFFHECDFSRCKTANLSIIASMREGRVKIHQGEIAMPGRHL